MNLKEHLILYVDDEFSNRLVFEQSFGKIFRVRAAGSGSEALEILKSEPVAAILTDQRMPEMSGHELLTRVKSLYPDTIRMVITAYSDYDPILRAVNEGLVLRYLIKPWDRAQLEQTLRWALEAYVLKAVSAELQLRLMHNERLATLGSIGGAMLHDLHQPLSHVAVNVERLAHLAQAAPKLAQLVRQHARNLSVEDRTNLEDLAVELPDIVRDMRSSGSVIGEMTKNLRQFLQPVRKDEPHSVDPVPVIRYALSVCKETAVRAQARQIYEGPETLPRVRIGSTELTQVFINLVANATQALLRNKKPGGRVVVGASEDAEVIRFVITDDGPGMPEEVLRRVGTPFFSTRTDGTGIGVSQCRRFVEGAGGDLKIGSIEGVGTTVSFTIPKAPPQP